MSDDAKSNDETPEETAASEPTADEPNASESTPEEPTAEEPAAEEPTAEEPTAEEPADDAPAALAAEAAEGVDAAPEAVEGEAQASESGVGGEGEWGETVRGWVERAGEDDLEGSWGVFVEGLGLLREGCRRPGPALEALWAGLDDVRQRLEGWEGLSGRLGEEVERLTAEYEAWMGRSELEPTEWATGANALRLEAQLLEGLVSGGSWEARILTSELGALERAIERSVASEPDLVPPLEEACRELQFQDVHRRAGSELAQPMPEEEDPAERAAVLWALRRRAQGLEADLQGLGREPEERAALVARSERLLAEVESLLGGLSEADRRAWVDRIVPEERERIETLAAEQEEMHPGKAAAKILHYLGRIQFLQRVRPKGGDKSKARLLARYQKRLRAEWVEKTVQERLETKYGRRFVTWLENTVLALILLVCVFLGVEMTMEVSEHTKWLLAYADGVICLVFLFEFFLKIAQAPDRWNYLKRHWLVDLLPSIPFGLVAIWLESLQQASHISVARGLRLARLGRLARYVRLARPILRVARIAIFAMRGADRVVRRRAALLSRQIVFFEPKEDEDGVDPVLRQVTVLRQRTAAGYLRAVGSLTPSEAAEHLQGSAEVLQRRLQAVHRPGRDEVSEEGGIEERREVRVEQVAEALKRVDALALEQRFPPTTIKQLARLSQLSTLPPARWLPVFRDMAKARQEVGDDPSAVLAFRARALGRGLERLIDTLHWLADLHGVVNAPLLLDRLGSAMAKAAERPAKRLLMFGGGFVLLTVMAQLIGNEWLDHFSGKIRNLLGVPILVLGGVCLLALFFGKWLCRVAGQASEFYARAAEAQFISLVKDVKRVRLGRHHDLLESRVLHPEVRLRGRDPATLPPSDASMDLPHRLARALAAEGGPPEPGGPAERVYLLYRHFLDGAPLHRSGVTITNQLLGNLVLENIRRERLGWSKAQLRELERLDLERAKGLSGPFLWYNLITLTVAQRTARLIVSYNTRCIPKRERALYTEGEVAGLERWLRERAGDVGEDRDDPPEALDFTRYRTTAFTALDFLTRDPERDVQIERAFGAEVVAAIATDRRRLIRDVFGTYPASRWPRAERSVNLYELYWRYVGGGRVLLFPLAMLWLALRLVWLGLQKLAVTVRDVINPHLNVRHTEADSNYEVSLRMINRMRKPAFMAVTWMRAKFDVEYLGLKIPGIPAGALRGVSCLDDLRFIGALEEEQAPFKQMREQSHEALETLGRFLREEGGLEGLSSGQVDVGEERHAEELRALGLAFGIDYGGVATQARLVQRLDDVIADAIEAQGEVSEPWYQRLWWSFTPRGIARRLAFSRYWHAHCAGRDDSACKAARRWALANRRELGDLLRATRASRFDPRGAAVEVARRVILHPSSWTEQLLTLRTVQTLALLEVVAEREIVRDLGEFEDAPERPGPVVLPRL